MVHHYDFATRAETKQEIFEYIEFFYNRKRRFQLIITHHYLSYCFAIFHSTCKTNTL